jgi:ESS family glutamate:Na+ symporter
MDNFWDFSVWGSFSLVAILLISLLLANMLKKYVKFLKNSLIPTSVLGGIILLIASAVYKSITGVYIFDTPFFGGNGMTKLEIITYHALALGFIASSLKTSNNKLNKKRTNEIFNTGVTTVSTYLLQGVLGLGITIM